MDATTTNIFIDSTNLDLLPTAELIHLLQTTFERLDYVEVARILASRESAKIAARISIELECQTLESKIADLAAEDSVTLLESNNGELERQQEINLERDRKELDSQRAMVERKYEDMDQLMDKRKRENGELRAKFVALMAANRNAKCEITRLRSKTESSKKSFSVATANIAELRHDNVALKAELEKVDGERRCMEKEIMDAQRHKGKEILTTSDDQVPRRRVKKMRSLAELMERTSQQIAPVSANSNKQFSSLIPDAPGHWCEETSSSSDDQVPRRRVKKMRSLAELMERTSQQTQCDRVEDGSSPACED